MKSSQNDSARLLARAAAKPDLSALRTELATVLAQSGGIRDRQSRAQNLRLCRWDGQSDDYRKHEDDIGGPAKPFEGAPDQRVPVVDIITRERVALMVEALFAGEIQAKPMGGLDTANDGTKMSRTLHWLRDNVLDEELRHEAELLCNYIEGDDPGIGILKIWWKREPALELRELSLADVALALLQTRGIALPRDEAGEISFELSQPYAGAVTDIDDLIFNVTREDEALDSLAIAFPTVARKRLKKALQQLRRERETTLPLPYVKENRPCVAALRYMQDVFFPSDLDDPQKARAIFEREWVSEAELRSRVHSDGYDADWVDQVLEAGPGGGELDGFNLVDNTWARIDGQTVRFGEVETDKLYEVWHAYSKAADDYGIMGVYWTVYSQKVRGAYAYHDLLDYPDGKYPHVLFRAEVIARGVDNVRGTPERAGSFQSEIKLQRDSRGAHTMMATVPPVRVAQRRGGLEAVLGPMMEVPVREAEDVSWMTPPPFPQASIEMEKAAWNDVNQYFGRVVPGMPTELAQALLQNDVNRWLGTWKLVWTKILQLQQEYGDTVQMQLVQGGDLVRYSRDEIRGKFKVSLTFSVRDLNMEFVMARNQAIGAVLQQDITGLADRTVIVRAGLRAIDPNLAEQAIRDPQAVTMKEMEDEKNAVNMMANGIEPPLRQTGINAQLRLQTLMDTVSGSRTLMARYQQPSTPADQDFRDLIDNRQKNLRFLVEQYQVNPSVGLQGTRAIQAGAGATSQPAQV